MKGRVLAIGAHPDDIEFGMSGTLLLLAKAGCEIHYMNMANGSCGTTEYDAATIVNIRLQEAKNAAGYLGATFYEPLVSDLEIYYLPELLKKLASIIRRVAPDMLLVPSPMDYMEDHTNTCRLAVTAAFVRGMPNFIVDPPISPISDDVVVYHAQPHGNRDAMDQLVRPNFYVNISSVIQEKTEMLALHRSQKEWLDHSQGFDSYLNTMKEYAREMGQLSGCFVFAEGWRRHNPLGFCPHDVNPLEELLGKYIYTSG